MVTIEYSCEDGTALPVSFASDDDAALPWALEREHFPHRQVPMASALMRLEAAGAHRAYHEVDMTLPPSFRPPPEAEGFAYYCTAPLGPDDMQSMFAGCSELVRKYGSALGVWEQYSLPRVREDCAVLDGAGPDRPLAELAEIQAHAQQLTMLPAYILGYDLDQLAESVGDALGCAPRLAASELAQGFPSQTLTADAALWALGRLVAASAGLQAAVNHDDPASAMAAVHDRGEEPAFFAALDDLLAVFGRRAEWWDVGAPTWAEMTPGFWNQLRTMARPGVPDPVEAVAAGAQRRLNLVVQVEAALAGDAKGLARFRRRLERAVPYVAVREDRALWQLIAVGCLRSAVLRRGATLVDAGLLDDPTDVLFLLPPEVEEPRQPDLRAVAAVRRAEHEAWLRVVPPPTIGVPAEPEAAIDAAGASAPAEGDAAEHRDRTAGDRGELWGLAGSRGVATGPARVLTELAAADDFEPGDVLVCTATSPPWTPLFGLAAAVVTDAGGPGSHAAIAAREYGIPCVLGTASATRVIASGSIVTVDGDRGVVTIAG